jgi:hypothetical protein
MGIEHELSQRDDEWQRRATAAAVAAARNIVLGDDAVINMNAPVGRLSDTEWGWIVCAAIFAWIRVRADQAAAEELDTELVIRTTGFAPNPWDAGAVAAILPALVDVPGVDWSKPLDQWSRETMISSLLAAFNLIRKAVVARSLSSRSITRTPKAGADELNDQLPFE